MTCDQLIESHLPLARKLARRFVGPMGCAEDLEQVAAVGLVKAARRFDAARGVAFSSFATPTIVGEIKRHFRDTAWAVHVPRSLQESAQRIEPTSRRLAAKLGRAPTAAELAEALGLRREDVIEARAALSARDAASLDAPGAGQSGDKHAQPAFGDRFGTPEAGYEAAEARATIEPALAHLSDRDRTALLLRYERELSQREISARIGVSQMQVSRILRAALTTLRAAIVEI
jgi:RNA polymerase sigma-B factor